MGFRDYYRQFDDIDEAELNLERRARRKREKRLALERLPDVDLSGTEWPDLPHSEIVNAAIARARGLVNRYPDRHAAGVRRLLAERHGVAPEQIALGQRRRRAAAGGRAGAAIRGDELVMPWPSYPLYPLLAAHAGREPVSVEHGPLLEAIGERTRAIVICNPNDPTGAYLPAEELGRPAVGAARGRARAARRGARPLPGRRGDRRLPAAGRRVPAPARGAHLLEGLRPVRACARATRWGRTRACWPRSRRCSA